MSPGKLNGKNLFELINNNPPKDLKSSMIAPAAVKTATNNSETKYEQLIEDQSTRTVRETTASLESAVYVAKEDNESLNNTTPSSRRQKVNSTSQTNDDSSRSKATLSDDWYDAGSSLIRSNYDSSDEEGENNSLYKQIDNNDEQMHNFISDHSKFNSKTDKCDQNGSDLTTPVIKRWFSQRPKQNPPAKGRTISQSMLDLEADQLHPNGFKVQWRNLSFSYKTWNRFTPEQKRRNQSSPQEDCESNDARNKTDLKRPAQILKNVSGEFSSNQLIALIGPSGCGKTTLLQFLAGNNPAQKDRIHICGLDKPKVALIGQDDCLINGLTPRETLMFASRLQHSDKSFDHATHIQTILNELGLAECADRSVTKLSGGQIKRVIIAQELLYPTNLLILDEVTSGLDASTSYSIIKLLKYLVADKSYPMSIVISIHQPSARLFDVFDKVYVMSSGCCLYEGSCKVDDINQYLSLFGLKCPKFHNIADYLIEIACENTNPHIKLIKEQMVQYQTRSYESPKLINSNGHSISYNCSRTSIDKLSLNKNNNIKSLDTFNCYPTRKTSSMTGGMDFKTDGVLVLTGKQSSFVNIFPEVNSEAPSSSVYCQDYNLYDAIERTRSSKYRPFWDHFVLHLNRSLLRISRSYILTYLQMFTYIVLGLQLATFFGPDIGTLSGCPHLPSSLISFVLSGEVDEDMTQEMRRVQENMNFLLVSVMTVTFAALEVTVITFPLEAKVVQREWRNGWYKISSYFVGRTLADLPFQMFYVIIFSLIIYSMTSQIGLLSWRFGSFVLCLIMTALIAQSVGFIFGAIFMNNLPAAVFSAPICIFPTLLFSGFFSRASLVPQLYRPFTYISHFRYSFDALLVTLYGYDRCYCDEYTLSSYHASMQNQTSSIKDIFMYMFGSNECMTSTSDEDKATDPTINAIGIDTTTPIPRDEYALKQLQEQTAKLYATTTPEPTSFVANLSTAITSTLAPAAAKFQTFEDALVDSVFEHMSTNTTTSLSPETTEQMSSHLSGNGIDNLANKFSNRIVTMLNKQSNFGHTLPANCSGFNSFLLVEFDLRNNDLIIGLAMLFVFVLITRILCNIILNYTIAIRN